MLAESLWDVAVKKSNERTAGVSETGERLLLLAGSKGAGKSTMIQRFLDRNEPVKETLAMEYSFGRKSGRSLTKDICHVWELGGGSLFSNLLPLHLGSERKMVTLILVLDLSSPETLWHLTEKILKQIDNHFKKRKEESTGRRIGENHEDFEYVSEFPVPLLIVGGKYDLFEKKFDPEKKKVVTRTLRSIAHSLAGSLVFYSDRDPTLVKRLKEVFNYYGFGGPLWKSSCTDFNKPISIIAGSDSFEQIGIGRTTSGQRGLELLLDRFKHTYTTHFPQSFETENLPEDPFKDANFKEPVIDGFRTEKDEVWHADGVIVNLELERYRKEIETRKKMNFNFEDKVGLLKRLEMRALEYNKRVEDESVKNDGTGWIPPFRFVLPLDLLLMQSVNYDKLFYLLLSEPEGAMQIARDALLCAVKEITGIRKSKIRESEIEIAIHLIVVPGVLFDSPKTSFQGLRSLRGILSAKSTAVKYARSSVYVCQTTGCIAFDCGERRRRPGPSESCRYCYEPLHEQVRFRDVGEEMVCKFVPGSGSAQTFKKYFSFTAKIKDELNLAIKLELGREYNLVGKIEEDSSMDVWHISDRLSCRKVSEDDRWDFDSILLPPFISQLYLSIEKNCKNSPWAFVIAISSLLGGNVVPFTSFLHLKIGLMLSLATQSSDKVPVHVLGVGADTSTVQKLFRSAGRLAERCVFYSADFAHLGGSIKRGIQAGAVWQEAGAMVLGIDGVCDLGDWSKFKKQQSDYVRNTLEKGEIVFSNKDAEHNNLTHSVPLRCSIWSYYNEGAAAKKADSRLKTLTDVFGMPFPIDERSNSEIEKICRKHLGNGPNLECGFSTQVKIPEEELKEFMMLVKKQNCLPIKEDASELIKNYFVASRKDRSDCLPVGAIKTITVLSEAHAKLALRSQVVLEDVVAVLYWYQEAASLLFGPTQYDFRAPPVETDEKPFYLLMDERLRSFKLWLTGYVDAFTVKVTR